MPSLAKKWMEQGMEKGMEKGIEKGRQEGIEKGIEKGMQEGKKEGAFQKAIETCKRLLLAKMTPLFVSETTDLPLQKVLEIQKSLK